MAALYLNGRLCNGNGRSKDEYKLSELKTIAKDNGVFIFSGSNKEDICKEIIKHTKTKALPIVIAPQIAQTKQPIAVQPTIITRAKAAAVADLSALKAAEERIAANVFKAAQAAKAAANAARAAEVKAASNAARAAEVKAAANAARSAQAKAASNAARAAEAKAASNAARAAEAKAASNAARAAQAKASVATKTRATPKPKETSNECVKQDDKKYAERPSPPYPANECRGKIMKGNNGEMYISKPTSTGVYRWVKNK